MFRSFCIGRYELKYDLNLVILTNKDKTSFLTATTLIYVNTAGITMAADARLTLK